MTLPHDLQAMIDAALIGVRDQTDTAYAPDFVFAIGNLFGHLLVNTPTLSRAQQRRIMLTLLTVRHTLPAWEQTWPTDRMPHSLLNSITQAVLYDFTSERVNQLADEVENWLLPYLTKQEEPSRMIGYSLSTILDALVAIIDGVIIDDRTPDRQMTIAMAFAAAAYARGTDPDATFDDDRWLAFWEAWLCHIVPVTWEQFPNISK